MHTLGKVCGVQRPRPSAGWLTGLLEGAWRRLHPPCFMLVVQPTPMRAPLAQSHLELAPPGPQGVAPHALHQCWSWTTLMLPMLERRCNQAAATFCRPSKLLLKAAGASSQAERARCRTRCGHHARPTVSSQGRRLLEGCARRPALLEVRKHVPLRIDQVQHLAQVIMQTSISVRRSRSYRPYYS